MQNVDTNRPQLPVKVKQQQNAQESSKADLDVKKETNVSSFDSKRNTNNQTED